MRLIALFVDHNFEGRLSRHVCWLKMWATVEHVRRVLLKYTTLCIFVDINMFFCCFYFGLLASISYSNSVPLHYFQYTVYRLNIKKKTKNKMSWKNIFESVFLWPCVSSRAAAGSVHLRLTANGKKQHRMMSSVNTIVECARPVTCPSAVIVGEASWGSWVWSCPWCYSGCRSAPEDSSGGSRWFGRRYWNTEMPKR